MEDFDFDLRDEEDLTLEFDFDPIAARETPPEKRLSSPIIDRICRRLIEAHDICDIPDRLKQHGHKYGPDTTRKDRFRRFASEHPLLFYSSLKKQYMQLAEILNICDHECELQVLTPKLYPELLSKAVFKRNSLQADLDRAQTVYLKCVEAFCSTLTDTLKGQRIRDLKQTLMVKQIDYTTVYKSSQVADTWSKIVDEYRRCVTRGRHIQRWRKFADFEITYASDYAVLRLGSEYSQPGTYLLCYEQLQMLQDAAQGRHNVDLALELNLNNGSQKLKSYVPLLLAWQDQCLKRYDNAGYNLVKSPEAVFKARLNSLTEGDILEYSSFDRTMEKIKEKERDIAGSSPMVNLLERIALSVTHLGDCAELFGITKLSGHPSVYAEKSADSVKKEALFRGRQKPYMIRQMTRCFKHVVLSGYIQKHGYWPPMTSYPLRHTELRRHFNNRVTDLPMSSYTLSDLDNLEFGKFCEFDYSEDYLKFLDDKAVCPGASELGMFWFGGERKESRRLLQKVITMSEFDTKALVERMRRGKTTREEEVVELTQKERELKEAARCFCKLVFAIRTFFTLTEYNLGEHFMKDYCPQQTMTMSDAQIKSRLYNMVKDKRHPGRVLLEVDFSRWNLRWREDTVTPIARILEDSFGLPGVFSQAHPFFARSTIVLTDKHTLPQGATPNTSVHAWPESSLVWRRHLGGFEGIQQKLWTMCTIAMMYVCMYDSNVSFLMAGQGDNQIFALRFQSKSLESTRNQLRRLLAIMEVRCTYLNHEVKPEECIDSGTVLTYSKEIYADGVHIQYSLKFLSRSLSVSDEDVPSLSKEISGISANAVMCADTLPVPFIGVFWQYLQLLRHISYRLSSDLHKQEHDVLRELFRSDAKTREFALLLPGSLGGLPLQSWARFFMKGEVDALSWDVAAVVASTRCSKLLAADFQLLLDGEYKPRTPKLTSLILDPGSIPINRPVDNIRLIKEHVSNSLFGITKNKWIEQVISSKTEAAGKELLNQLSQTTPFFPKILHDLYSYSPAGVRDAMLSRFNMTRTIVGLTGNKSFLSEILHSNIALCRFVKNRAVLSAQQHSSPKFLKKGFEYCRQLRSQWGDHVTHQDIGTYTPFDFQICLGSTKQAAITATSRTPVSEVARTVGPYPPNFGTKTRAKISDHGFKIITSSSTIGDLRALMIIYSELGSQDSLKPLINELVQARCPWSVDELKHIMPSVYGGTASHRHDTLQQSSFAVLGSKTVPTHLNFSSDNTGVLAGGELDYPVAFQEHYLFLTNISQLLSQSGAPREEAICLSLLVPETLCPVTTDAVQLAPNLPDIRWPTYYANALISATVLQFKHQPSIPDKDIITHSQKRRDPRSLLFSSFLSKSRNTPGSYRDSRHSIVMPIDILDIAEFTHCNPAQVIEAASAFVAIESVYQSLRARHQNSGLLLSSIMCKVAMSIAGPLGRLFLYETELHDKYTHELGLTMLPGAAGAEHVAAKVCGEIINGAKYYLSMSTLKSQKFEFIVFEDTSAHCHIALFKIAMYWFSWLDGNRLSVPNNRRANLVITQARSTGGTTSIFAAERLLQQIRHVIREDEYLKRADIRGPLVTYWHTTLAEGLRTLRTQQRVKLRPDYLETRTLIQYSTDSGLVKVIKTGQIGKLNPLMETVENNREKQRIEVLLRKILRPLGRFTSTPSIWIPLLAKTMKYHKYYTDTVSIGVGHGGVAYSLLEVGKSTVSGVDLRNSFPRITQRERGYKPPEVRQHKRDEDYEWHPAVWETGGDILQLNTFEMVFDSPDKLYVIDIESNFLNLAKRLCLLPAGYKIIWRFQCSEEQCRYLCSLFDVELLFNLSYNRTLPSQDWCIIITTREVPFRSGSSARYSLELSTRFIPKIKKVDDYYTARYNDFVRELGYKTDKFDLGELKISKEKMIKESETLEDMDLKELFSRRIRVLSLVQNFVHERYIQRKIKMLLDAEPAEARISCSLIGKFETINSEMISQIEEYSSRLPVNL